MRLLMMVAVVLLLLSSPTMAQEPKKNNPRPADPAKVAEAIKQLDALLVASPEKMGSLAKQLANEAREVGLTGTLLAKVQVQEELLLQTRLEALKIAEEAAKERKALRADLDKELNDIRSQFKDDANRCDEELGMVLAGYLPMLRTLKTTETEYTAIAQKTTSRLNQLRQEKSSLDREAMSIRKGLTSAREVRLMITPPDLPERRLVDPSQGKDKKPLKELLEELKKLD